MGAGRLGGFRITARRLAVGGALALGMAAMTPAAMAGPFDVLKSIPIPSMPPPKPAQPAPSQNDGGSAPGAPTGARRRGRPGRTPSRPPGPEGGR